MTCLCLLNACAGMVPRVPRTCVLRVRWVYDNTPFCHHLNACAPRTSRPHKPVISPAVPGERTEIVDSSFFVFFFVFDNDQPAVEWCPNRHSLHGHVIYSHIHGGFLISITLFWVSLCFQTMSARQGPIYYCAVVKGLFFVP